MQLAMMHGLIWTTAGLQLSV